MVEERGLEPPTPWSRAITKFNHFPELIGSVDVNKSKR